MGATSSVVAFSARVTSSAATSSTVDLVDAGWHSQEWLSLAGLSGILLAGPHHQRQHHWGRKHNISLPPLTPRHSLPKGMVG